MTKKRIDWGERTRQRRHDADPPMSRLALAEIIGVSARTIESWEQGRSRPDRRARRALRAWWRDGAESGERERERERMMVERQVTKDDDHEAMVEWPEGE